MQQKKTMTAGAVVTCSNYGRYLKQCLMSVKRQTLAFDKLVLIDDASTDDTEEVWRKYFSHDVVYKRVNCQNPKAARDEGIRICQTDLIVCLDADDWLHRDYLKTLSLPFEHDSTLGVVYCDRKREDQSREKWFPAPSIHSLPFSLGLFFTKDFVPSAALFRRKFWPFGIEDFGLELIPGEVYAEDWETWLVMAMKGCQFKHIPQKLIHYRIHDNNYSKKVEKGDYKTHAISLRRLPYEKTYLFFRTQADVNPHQLEALLEKMPVTNRDQVLFIDGVGGESELEMRFKKFTYLDFSHVNLLNYEHWFIYVFQEAKNYILGKEIVWINFDEKQYFEHYETNVPNLFLKDELKVNACFPNKQCPPLWIKLDYEYFLEYLKKIGSNWALLAKDFLQTFPEVKANGSSCLSDMTEAVFSYPFVSIVVPVKDSERMLLRLLQSLEKLRYPKERYEVIVIDNASTDNTVQVANQFEDVQVFSESKPSSYAARNLGIKKSQYDLIAFLDTDCAVAVDWLADMVLPLENDKRIGVVCGENYSFNEASHLSKIERARGAYQNVERLAHWGYGYAITMNVIYRRKVFDQVGQFDDDVISGSDVDMSWRAQKKGKWRLCKLKDKGIVYHEDATSLATIFKRHQRMGKGHYCLYFYKYPQLLLHHYYYLPRTKFEIYFQFFKKMIRSLFFKNPLHHFLEGFCALAQKLGLLELLEIDRSTFLGQNLFIYDSAQDLDLSSPIFRELLAKRNQMNQVNLFIGAPYRDFGVLILRLKRILGLTTFWVWPNRWFYFKPTRSITFEAARWKSVFSYLKEFVDLRGIQQITYVGDNNKSLKIFLEKNYQGVKLVNENNPEKKSMGLESIQESI